MNEETPPLFRTHCPVIDGKIVETKTLDLFVWAAVDTETGDVDVMNIEPFDDELPKLIPGAEWRRFRLVPENETGKEHPKKFREVPEDERNLMWKVGRLFGWDVVYYDPSVGPKTGRPAYGPFWGNRACYNAGGQGYPMTAPEKLDPVHDYLAPGAASEIYFEQALQKVGAEGFFCYSWRDRINKFASQHNAQHFKDISLATRYRWLLEQKDIISKEAWK